MDINYKSEQQNKSGKKKIFIILALIIAVVIIAAGVMYKVFHANKIVFIGGNHYTDEELTEYIFGSDNVNTIVFKLFGEKDKNIPFIQRYDVEIKWPDRIDITIYEKPIVGYVKYMGCYMYFDRDGTVVESSTHIYEGVPEIDGLKFDSIVLDSKLDVGNTAIFNVILDLTQSFDKYDINVDKVFFDKEYNVFLYMGKVKVSLGQGRDFTDKLFELKQMSPRFGSLKGTLYLDEYNGDANSIIFKQDK